MIVRVRKNKKPNDSAARRAAEAKYQRVGGGGALASSLRLLRGKGWESRSLAAWGALAAPGKLPTPLRTQLQNRGDTDRHAAATSKKAAPDSVGWPRCRPALALAKAPRGTEIWYWEPRLSASRGDRPLQSRAAAAREPGLIQRHAAKRGRLKKPSRAAAYLGKPNAGKPYKTAVGPILAPTLGT